MITEWEKLPDSIKCDEVRFYYDILKKRKKSLFLKRIFDLIVSIIAFILTAIPMIVIAIIIKLTSNGPVFYRQERVTTNGKIFRIHKFRTMVENADKIGSFVTVKGDSRVTGVGRFLRKYRLDELPQVIDVIVGNMSLVGTRPEVKKYVDRYTPQMMATLLLPAGITSEASIRYKDEAKLLDNADDADKVYVDIILPEKMRYNLRSIEEYSFLGDVKTMFRTVLAVLGKEYSG